MDAQDFAILARLFEEPRASYEELGERVDLSANAVKARLRKMEDEGVLRGFVALPDPSLLGLRAGLLVFTAVDDLDEREEELLRSLPDVPGVRFADVALDHAVYVWLYHRDEADLDRIERAAISLVGKPPAHRFLDDAPEPARMLLSSADWRIVQAILSEGRATLKELSARAGLSFKTAKRRLEALLHAGVLRVEPVLSPSEAAGAVMYTILVQLHERADAGSLRPMLPPLAITQQREGSRLVVVHGQRRSLREAQTDLRALKSVPGVQHAFLSIATRRHADGWLEEAVRARLAAPAPAAPPMPLARSP